MRVILETSTRPRPCGEPPRPACSPDTPSHRHWIPEETAGSESPERPAGGGCPTTMCLYYIELFCSILVVSTVQAMNCDTYTRVHDGVCHAVGAVRTRLLISAMMITGRRAAPHPLPARMTRWRRLRGR